VYQIVILLKKETYMDIFRIIIYVYIYLYIFLYEKLYMWSKRLHFLEIKHI